MHDKLLGPEAAASQELIRDLRILGSLDPVARDQLAKVLNSIPEKATQEPVATAIETMIRLLRELNSLSSAGAEQETAPQDPWLPFFELELAAFQKALPSLLKSHPGKYVAMLGGEIVDEDNDEFALAGRIEDRYPKQFVLIRRVSLDEDVEDIPSIEGEY